MLLANFEYQPDAGQVLRYLGYPADAGPAPRMVARVDAAIRSLPRVDLKAVYSMYPVVEHGPHSLKLPGGTFTGAIGEFLAPAQRVAVFVATAGPEIVALSDEAFRARDTLGGMVYNALGSHLAEVAVDRVLEDLRAHLAPGESLTMPYSPGYCGIALSQQHVLFGLVDAGLAGVELLPTLIMKPVKSISGIVGLGPAEQIAPYRSACDQCLLDTCRMRR